MRKQRIKVIHVVGARPNFMKIAPIMAEMERYPDTFAQILVHTGQHYDDNMSQLFFDDLKLPEPDIYLGVGSGTHAQQTAKIMLAFEPVINQQRVDWVIVVGDVNSTVACALTATKMGIKVAHVEAGLRSFDRTMPEEINRLLTDQIADLLFTTELSANDNLRREGVAAEKICFVGNVMIDTLLRHKERALDLEVLEPLGLAANGYGLLTLHRPANVDTEEVLSGILDALKQIQTQLPLVFPAHPRTLKRIDEFGLRERLAAMPGLRVLEPVGYLKFLNLMANAKLVLTDSGGIQEETTLLGVPCLTLRENTERPVTVTSGTNTIVGSNPEIIRRHARSILSGKVTTGTLPELWDGKAAKRIISTFKQEVLCES